MNTSEENRNKLDLYGRKMIDILKTEGRITVTELAKRIGISKSPCQKRLQRLQDDGFILGFKAIINHAKVDQEHVAFAEVKMTDTREDALNAFNEAIKKLPEVEECHLIAGSFDYLLKVRTSDISAYRRVLGESISSLANVANTSTYVAMQSVKSSDGK